MVVSSAFKQLSMVLAELESSGTDIQHAGVNEDLTGSTAEVTAELAVEVPLLSGTETGDQVSIAATDAEIVDGQVAVDLTVTVSGQGDEQIGTTGSSGDSSTGVGSAARTTPAYKDPEALQAVYEQHDTFPEMTDALQVDVTSETVRRHMVDHGIHDPADATPSSLEAQVGTGSDEADSTTGGTETTESTSTDAEIPTGTEQVGETQSGTGEASETRATGSTTADGPRQEPGREDSPAVSDGSAESEAPGTGSAVTDGGNPATDEPTATADSPWADRPVTEAVAAAPDADDAGGPVGGGLDLPATLTVAGLADTINQSRTVHEVARHADLDRGTARQLLERFDLIHLVSHPLATDRITVSVEEVVGRIGATGQ